MADREKVNRITFSLSELFPEKKSEIEKEKYYYNHNYCTFYDWEENIIKIISIAA